MKKIKIENFLGVLSAIILIIGFTLTIGQFKDNNRAIRFAKKQILLANQSKSSAAPSTTPISNSSLNSYNVAPNMPRYLIIPAIGVKAPILDLGVTSSNAIAAPPNIYETGWYNGSSKPGQTGVALIDGHVSSWTAKGVFYNIESLKSGDQIMVQMGNNTIYTYYVIRVSAYSISNINMNQILTPLNNAESDLNLISCYGDVIKGTNTFNDRVVVFSKLQN